MGSLLSGSAMAAGAVLLGAAAASYAGAQAAFAPLRATLRHQLACLSAVVCVLHPYTMGTLYLRNALAEFAAVCLFPLVLWATLGTFAQPASEQASTAQPPDAPGPSPMRAALRVAAVVAALVLTHNLSALVGVAFMLGTALVGCLARRRAGRRRPARSGLCSLGGGFVLALALSAYFWLPALGYNHLTRTAVELREGKLDFHNNFAPWLSNFGLSEFYGAGPLLLVALPLGLLYRPADRAGEPLVPGLRAALAWFSGVLLCLLLPQTAPVWEAVPFLPLVQFPFRFLGPLGFVGALCLARLLAPLLERLSPGRWPLVALAALVVAGAQAAVPLTRARALPEAVRRDFDGAATPDAMRNNPGAMATFRWEYIPPTADRELWKRDRTYAGALHRSLGAVRARVLADAPRRILVEAQAQAAPPAHPTAAPAAALVLRRYWVPGFEAWVDGAQVPAGAAPDGLVAVGVPAGSHRVLVTHGPPPLRQLGLAISFVASLVFAALYARSRRSTASLM